MDTLGSAPRISPSRARRKVAPARWAKPATHTENTLHQISPYIGKLKSHIANDLISRFTEVGDIIVDPFSGSGTIPLEAALCGRQVFCGDISDYARVLTVAKLFPPSSLEIALGQANDALTRAETLPPPDLRKVPSWVRKFFHPTTLKEALRFAEICRKPGREFLFACFLGILHHQRPGFLSYPSSHLVPYLRDKKYPRSDFPELYAYRPIKERLLAKIRRAFKRNDIVFNCPRYFQQNRVENAKLPQRFDALITSPPYMNALDYGRDNRLRLWFINPLEEEMFDTKATSGRQIFEDSMKELIVQIESNLNIDGHCIFIVGEAIKRGFKAHPANAVASLMSKHAPSLRLTQTITDVIPDIRRTRRSYRGVKKEEILIYCKM